MKKAFRVVLMHDTKNPRVVMSRVGSAETQQSEGGWLTHVQRGVWLTLIILLLKC